MPDPSTSPPPRAQAWDVLAALLTLLPAPLRPPGHTVTFATAARLVAAEDEAALDRLRADLAWCIRGDHGGVLRRLRERAARAIAARRGRGRYGRHDGGLDGRHDGGLDGRHDGGLDGGLAARAIAARREARR